MLRRDRLVTDLLFGLVARNAGSDRGEGDALDQGAVLHETSGVFIQVPMTVV
jgi:hypothetical protein